ncbi:unnamed protein product [Arabidopsis thaliana]|nr:unnamed protein product [Arabidopsis thaliana]
MSSMNMIKITMMMALVLMGVRATTVTQSQETDRKFECHSMNHIACTGCLFGCGIMECTGTQRCVI